MSGESIDSEKELVELRPLQSMDIDFTENSVDNIVKIDVYSSKEQLYNIKDDEKQTDEAVKARIDVTEAMKEDSPKEDHRRPTDETAEAKVAISEVIEKNKPEEEHRKQTDEAAEAKFNVTKAIEEDTPKEEQRKQTGKASEAKVDVTEVTEEDTSKEECRIQTDEASEANIDVTEVMEEDSTKEEHRKQTDNPSEAKVDVREVMDKDSPRQEHRKQTDEAAAAKVDVSEVMEKDTPREDHTKQNEAAEAKVDVSEVMEKYTPKEEQRKQRNEAVDVKMDVTDVTKKDISIEECTKQVDDVAEAKVDVTEAMEEDTLIEDHEIQTDASAKLDSSKVMQKNKLEKQTNKVADAKDHVAEVMEEDTQEEYKKAQEVIDVNKSDDPTPSLICQEKGEEIQKCDLEVAIAALQKELEPEQQEQCKGDATSSFIPEEQPSTSQAVMLGSEMDPDASDEIPEVTDSLGLLAESSRPLEYEDQDEDDDGDDEEFDDQDDESNHMMTEQSEDSNAQQSETDAPDDVIAEHTATDASVVCTPKTDVAIATKVQQAEMELVDETNESLVGLGPIISEDTNASASENLDIVEKDSINGCVVNSAKEAVVDVEVVPNFGEVIPMGVPEHEDDKTTGPAEKQDGEKEPISTTVEEAMVQISVKTKEVTAESSEIETVTALAIDNNMVPKSKLECQKQDAILFNLLGGDSDSTDLVDISKDTEEKTEKKGQIKPRQLEISKLKNVLNIVDLEESSSEDDTPEVTGVIEPLDNKDTYADAITESSTESQQNPNDDMTSVNLPKDIDVMSNSCGNTSDIVAVEKNIIISGLPKPAPPKLARINTSEVSIKTVAVDSTIVIPETKLKEESLGGDDKNASDINMEVFSIDSEDDDHIDKEDSVPSSPTMSSAESPEKVHTKNQCVNSVCPSKGKRDVTYYSAPFNVVNYYDSNKKKWANCYVCQACMDYYDVRMQHLIDGVKNMTPLLELDMHKPGNQDLVEISDSDSDSDAEETGSASEHVTAEDVEYLEEMELGDLINETWKKYNLDQRLQETELELKKQINQYEKECKEITAMFDECQLATDTLRSEIYATFPVEKKQIGTVDINENQQYVSMQASKHNRTSSIASESESSDTEARRSKRLRRIPQPVQTENGMTITLGYPPAEKETTVTTSQDQKEQLKTAESSPLPSVQDRNEDDTDVSVVKLSAESAPPDLPPPGELIRGTLQAGDNVYAMRNTNGSWIRGRVIEFYPKGSQSGSSTFSFYKVKLDSKLKGFKHQGVRVLSAKHVAYSEPATVRLTIGTRVIAIFKNTGNTNVRASFYSGIVAEIPNPVNNYRYLVFFDDGYAQYVTHGNTRVVTENSTRVWEDVHIDSREFVHNYLTAYPERPMVRLHAGQYLKIEWNGKWWTSRVIQVDASLVKVYFEADNRTEWIYRGSTRLFPLFLELQAAERPRARGLTRTNNPQPLKPNMPYVEYTRNDEQGNRTAEAQQNEDMRKQRSVAKKSTTALPPAPLAQIPTDNFMSRVVYYTPKAAVKPHKMVTHFCSSKCKRTDVLPLKELRTYNPLARPLLSGWERQLLRFKGRKVVMYRAPCGRRVRNMPELHRYLRATYSDMGVDLFDFNVNMHCLAEFVLNRCNVSKKDLSHGKENVPVPCVNYYDSSLPEFCSYNTDRTPTNGVPLNLDPDFLCGCDCTDDCQDKTKCACWKMTLEGARTIRMEGEDIGYVYKRLPEPLPTGIFECNSRCKCKHTCLNRVAQHPLQLKLQVFKTQNRGWGIRALNDVPKGAFLCVYAGNLLTDATANVDGLTEGDEYLAELDYIEVVEQMKEGYESDVVEKGNQSDKNEDDTDDDEDVEDEPSDDENKGDDKEDFDFKPAYELPDATSEFNKRLRKRVKKEKMEQKKKEKEEKERDDNGEEDCITISDDDEVREPSRFTVQAGIDDKEYVSKHRSVRTLFGKDEACYIMDAKVQGNIGRYLNHSCSPNVFVQNVFVDTHDPRFPWVAFFALSHVRAGTELTWNYNYDVGSVPGKVMYCRCGAPNCRGRLL